MGRVLAIDPGCVDSAWLEYDPESGRPRGWAKEANRIVLARIDRFSGAMLAIESIASYGMAVGAEVFETCVWAGRFIERWLLDPGSRRGAHRPLVRVYRREVKAHLCGSQRAKDSNVRMALIDRYGPGREKAVGRKASPGPLYGMKADCWSALAVAITAVET